MTPEDTTLSAPSPPPAETGQVLSLGPDAFLACETVERAAAGRNLRLPLTETARRRMHLSWDALRCLQAGGTPIYGTTTGFGPFVVYPGAGDREGVCQADSLLAHLGAGWNPPDRPDTPIDIVRAAMIIRGQNLAQGHSAIHPRTLEAYLRWAEWDLTPCVPWTGSVGASGDLIPLAHIARAVAGAEDALVRYRGRTLSAREALRETELAPVRLTGREALALTNGTSFLTAFAAIGVARSERLLRRAEEITGWLYRLLEARADALAAPLHIARGQEGQILSARHIRTEAGRYGAWENAERPLQEVYSLRCAPQILGACRENLTFARRLVETEINGVSDNPIFFGDADGSGAPQVFHGGNFHGQQVAFAADALNAALTQAAVLAERQIDLLVTPSTVNGNAPLLLAWDPGSTSGMAGAQITATALVAEMRAAAQAHATMSLPTNGRNQDVVSMGALAAQRCYEQTDRLSAVLSILSLCAAQLTFLRSEDKAAGPPAPLPRWMTDFEGIRHDRPLQAAIARLAAFLRDNVPDD
ncbi:MAG: aromatic amino acid ammonia-lyase [Capsulimonadales bacterium]|nr:aromatic amino acid ammonia-lyase [Capsulimonadales bacterium]